MPLDPALTQIPGLSQYLAMKQYMIDQGQQEQQRGLQQQFLQKRQELGPNATPEQLIGLGTKYLGPKEVVDVAGKHLDRQDTNARLLMTARENALLRRDTLQQNAEGAAARLKRQEDRDVSDAYYKQQLLDSNSHIKELDLQLKRMGIDIAQQNADTNRMRAEQVLNKNDEPLQNMLDKIDVTKRMIVANPEAVGGRGMLGRGAEFVGSMVNPGQETPASNLQSQILDLQTTYRGLPGHAASRLKIDADNIDKLIKGLGTFTAPDQAIGSLDTLRATIAKQLERRAGAVDAPAEAPQAPEAPVQAPIQQSFPAAPASSRDRKANTIYQTPRGPLRWTGTGWVPR